MKIVHYSYDNVNNPHCGGGGAYRELTIHKLLSSQHEIFYYSGNFKGAKSYSESGVYFSHLGFGANYLLSRITFSIFATIHSLFVQADLIVIGYSVFSPVLTFLFRNQKTVIEFYHITGKEPFRKYFIFGIFPWLAERAALHFGKHFITLTDSLATLIKKKYPNKNVCAAYTGYDTSILSENKYDDNYILYFGRIDVHMKGLDILIDSFEKVASSFPSYNLQIAGRGSKTDIAWLEKRIDDSSVSNRIKFTNNVSKSEKDTLFKHATFVCMPSRFEGWCISAIEAAACSKATLGTQIMGLKDSIKDNETGFLIPAQDVNALADKMKLLLNDETLRNQFGKSGYKWAQNFTWENVAGIQEKFYKEIVAKI